MQKCFYIRNAHENEEALLFGDESLRTCKVATIKGEFDRDGQRIPSIIKRHTGTATTAGFMNSLRDLFHFLQTDYMNGMLENAEAMADFCKSCDGVHYFEKDEKQYHGFETHTEDYFFYISCQIGQPVEETKFTIQCYDRNALIAKGIKEPNEEV